MARLILSSTLLLALASLACAGQPYCGSCRSCPYAPTCWRPGMPGIYAAAAWQPGLCGVYAQTQWTPAPPCPPCPAWVVESAAATTPLPAAELLPPPQAIGK